MFFVSFQLIVLVLISYYCPIKTSNHFVQKFKGRVSGLKVKAVDTTGAGDAFVGAILNSLASDVNLYKVIC